MKIYIIVYLLLGLIDAQCDIRKKKRVLKPVLMPMMMGLAFFGGARNLLLYAALFFGWIGDLFLIGSNMKMFACGLVSFLLGHLCYMGLFAQQIHGLSVLSVVGASGYVIWWVFVYRRLRNHVKDRLKIAVPAYMAGLATMSWLALAGGNTLLWLGSLSFCISDQLIAYRTFLKGSGIGVMETYVLAQLLIVLAMIKPTF